MVWENCGKNPDTGGMMGYCYSGQCNHPGCKEIINHGITYVCGGMHLGGEYGCGKYYCSNHLYYGHDFRDEENDITIWLYNENLCEECCKFYEKEYFENKFYQKTFDDLKDHLWHSGWLACEFCQDYLAMHRDYGCYACNYCKLKEE